jgi:hypothetical protein
LAREFCALSAQNSLYFVEGCFAEVVNILVLNESGSIAARALGIGSALTFVPLLTDLGSSPFAVAFTGSCDNFFAITFGTFFFVFVLGHNIPPVRKYNIQWMTLLCPAKSF